MRRGRLEEDCGWGILPQSALDHGEAGKDCGWKPQPREDCGWKPQARRGLARNHPPAGLSGFGKCPTINRAPLLAYRWPMKTLRRSLLCLILLCACGCPATRPPNATSEATSSSSGTENGSSSQPPAIAELRLTVIDDADLAQAIEREWGAISDTRLVIDHVRESDWLAAMRQDDGAGQVDAVIYPSRLLGELVERRRLVPLPQRLQESDLFAAADILPLVRREEIVWGKSTYAVSLGCPTFVLAHPASLAVDAATDVRTWDGFSRWLSGLPEHVQLTLPTARGWAVDLFLARAASDVRASGQVSTLFDFRTMEPLIDRAPYVRALEDLATLMQSRQAPLDLTPADVCDAVLSGSSVGWLWWGPGTKQRDETPATPLRFGPLPGSDQVFSFANDAWQPRRGGEPRLVPLTGLSGRLGSVMQSSRRQRAAWNLLLRVTGVELGARTSAVSRHTAPFRMSQMEQVALWVPAGLDGGAVRGYGEAVRESLVQYACLSSLRLPGQDAYRGPLDDAVRQVLAGEVSAADALADVATRWEAITQSWGRETQRAAYCRGLGIDP